MTKHTLVMLFTLLAVGCGDIGDRRSGRPSIILVSHSDRRTEASSSDGGGTEASNSPETVERPRVAVRRISLQIVSKPVSEVVGEYRLSADKTLFTVTADGRVRHHRADDVVKDFELLAVLDSGRELQIILNEVWHPIEKQIIRLKKVAGPGNGYSLLIGNRPPVALFRVTSTEAS